jgi:YVTN family beta-propeller protein
MRALPRFLPALILALASLLLSQEKPHAIPGGFALPNGWKITPLGKTIPTEDLVLNTVAAPDGRAVIALHAGYNQHGLVVVDTKTEQAVQRIPLPAVWLGMAWSPNGKRLYVSGGNATGKRTRNRAPIYIFDYQGGRLSEKPVGSLEETIDMTRIYWSGLAHHPKRNILFAANRGTAAATPGSIAAFDTESGKLVSRVEVEMNPYDLVLNADGSRLYASNWGSGSVSVIDTGAMKVVSTIAVGPNPNDLELGPDGASMCPVRMTTASS